MLDSLVELRGVPSRGARRIRRRSAAEIAVLERAVDRLARWMDTRYRMPMVGWRFGLDPLVGLVPVIGDLASTVVAIYIVMLAARCGLPNITIARMSVNVAIDMLVGSVPVLGDAFDLWWKANVRNAVLLHVRMRESEVRRHRDEITDWVFVVVAVAALVAVFVASLALSARLLSAVWNAI
jgi:hypothetical protein